MPHIKKLRVSFDVDMEVLLKAIAVGNSGFNIEAYQQATVEDEPLLLEDQSPGSLRDLVLGRLGQTGRPVKVSELRQLATEHGYTSKQLGNLLYVLYTSRLVSRPAKATYKITKRGMA